jgi:hypothetical protein
VPQAAALGWDRAAPPVQRLLSQRDPSYFTGTRFRGTAKWDEKVKNGGSAEPPGPKAAS